MQAWILRLVQVEKEWTVRQLRSRPVAAWGTVWDVCSPQPVYIVGAAMWDQEVPGPALRHGLESTLCGHRDLSRVI